MPDSWHAFWRKEAATGAGLRPPRRTPPGRRAHDAATAPGRAGRRGAAPPPSLRAAPSARHGRAAALRPRSRRGIPGRGGRAGMKRLFTAGVAARAILGSRLTTHNPSPAAAFLLKLGAPKRRAAVERLIRRRTGKRSFFR